MHLDSSSSSKPSLRPPPSLEHRPRPVSMISMHSRGSFFFDPADQNTSPATASSPGHSFSERWKFLRRNRQNHSHAPSETPKRVTTPQTISAPVFDSPAPTTAHSLRVSRPTSPFQLPLYSNSTSSLSSSSSHLANIRSRSSSPVTTFTLEPTSPQSPSLPRSKTPNKTHNQYVQHALVNQNQVPKHAISSSRMSRHMFNQSFQNTSQPPSSSTEHRTSVYLEQVQSAVPADSDDDVPSDRRDIQDSLTVNVMKLPKNLHQHNSSAVTIVSPMPNSTRSSVMSVIPPMQNVWLDDDDEDENDKLGKKEMFRKSIRSKHKSTTSVNRYSGHESTYELAVTASNAKRRSRKSFGYGRDAEESSILQKLKRTFSTSPENSHLDPIMDNSPMLSKPSQYGSSSQTGNSINVRPATPPSTETPQNALPFHHATSANTLRSPKSPAKSLQRQISAAKVTRSLSSRSSIRTIGASSKHTTSGQSAASKFLGLLSSKSHKLTKKTGNSLSTGIPRTLDKNKISAPVNLTHTTNAGIPLKPISSISTTKSRLQPNRPDRPTGAEVSTDVSGNIPALSSSSVSQRSSFVASPNTFNIAADQISISTASAEEYSPSSALKHRMLFSRFNQGNGSRTSFHGLDSEETGLACRQSIDSMRSNNLHPTSSPTPRPYSIQVSSQRARARHSVHSTISVDSVSSNTVATGYTYDEQTSSGLLLTSPMIPGLPDSKSHSSAPVDMPASRVEYNSLDRVREEGWF